jgi:hypothetical protein
MSFKTKLELLGLAGTALAAWYLWQKFKAYAASHNIGVTAGNFVDWLLNKPIAPLPPTSSGTEDPSGEGVVVTANPDGSTTATDTGGGTVTGAGSQPPNDGQTP